MTKLYKHQQDLLDLNPARHGLFWSTGTGKTIMLIELAKKNGVIPLIITPKALAAQWRLQVPSSWPIITKEAFRRDWSILPAHKAVIVDECFISGTKVLTPNGYIEIQKIKKGDLVTNALGNHRVSMVHTNFTNELVKINLNNGKEIFVTPNHPFFTIKGWKKAADLSRNDELLHYSVVHEIMSTYEMPSLQKTYKSRYKKSLFEVLFAQLSMEILPTTSPGTCRVSKNRIFNKNEDTQSNERSENCCQSTGNPTENRSSSNDTWWKWKRNARATKNFACRPWRWLVCRKISPNKNTTWKWFSNLLQNRYFKSNENDCNRDRWQFSRPEINKKKRLEKTKIPRTIGVESIEIQKQRNTRVFNLSVEGHPSYVVEEILVHNCHHFANYKSQLSKALMGYSKKHDVKYRWLATATPFRSSPMDIYSLALHLGHKMDYWAFFNRFFSQVRMGHRMIPKARAGKEKELAEVVKKIGSTAKLEDLIDLPPQVHEVEYLELTKEQEKAIKDIEETNYIVRFTKQHEIEQGVLLGGEYGTNVSYPSFKVDRVLELAEEHSKLAVFCRYNLQIDMLKDKLEAAGKKVWIIRGDTKDRAAVVREVDTADSGIVLVNAMCSEGYELPSIRTFIFASLSWSFVNFVQACGRNNRINKPERNLYINFVIKDGVDEQVFKAIERKQDFSLEIYKK